MRIFTADVPYPRGFCSNIRRASVSHIPLFGAYRSGGDTAEITPWGPFHLKANDSATSYVELEPTHLANRGAAFTFSELVSLHATFRSIAGGASTGSPRLTLALSDDDGLERNLTIYLGHSPDFFDSDAALNEFSGFNVIGNYDPGRYDTSDFDGGCPYTDYWDSLPLVGRLEIKKIVFSIGGAGNRGERQEILFSIGGAVRRRSAPLDSFSLSGVRKRSPVLI